jgi:hypothetical protein
MLRWHIAYHHQGARIVPSWSHVLKLWVFHYEWCGSISWICVYVVSSAGRFVDCVLMFFVWISCSKVIVKHIKKGGMNETWQQNVSKKNENNMAKRMKNATPATEQSALIAALCEKCSTNRCTHVDKVCRGIVYVIKPTFLHIRNVPSDTIFYATCFGGGQSFSCTHSQRHYFVIVCVLCVQVVGFIIWIKFISHCMEWQTSEDIVKTCVV